MDNVVMEGTFMKNPGKGKRVAAGFCSFLSIVLLIAVILVCVPLTIPKLMGYEVYTVISGSMEPEIPVGSLVLVHPEDPLTIAEKDVIAFYGHDDSGAIITHRVLANQTVSGEFITKGDANTDADLYPVPYANLIGKVVWSAPKLGEILATIATKTGKAAVAGVIGIVLVLQILAGLLKKEKKE